MGAENKKGKEAVRFITVNSGRPLFAYYIYCS